MNYEMAYIGMREKFVKEWKKTQELQKQLDTAKKYIINQCNKNCDGPCDCDENLKQLEG